MFFADVMEALFDPQSRVKRRWLRLKIYNICNDFLTDSEIETEVSRRSDKQIHFLLLCICSLSVPHRSSLVSIKSCTKALSLISFPRLGSRWLHPFHNHRNFTECDFPSTQLQEPLLEKSRQEKKENKQQSLSSKL